MHKSLVFGDEFLDKGLHLKLHFSSWLSVDQSSSSTPTESIIYFLTLPYTQRHCHVRIEKGPAQTVAIILEAHNSLEYYYLFKH